MKLLNLTRGTRIKPDLCIPPACLLKNGGHRDHITVVICEKLIISLNQYKKQKCYIALPPQEQCDIPKYISCNGIDHNATEEGKCERN